jgi:hypothetical protein
MMGPADLVAAVSARVTCCEMARRAPDWDGRSVTLPEGLGPLTVLAGRVYPTFVLERRLQFLRAVGWLSETHVGPEARAALPPDASVEDHLAVLYGAGPHDPLVAGPQAGVDPALVALGRALRGGDRGSDASDRDRIDALDAFFDSLADTIDPGWQHRSPREVSATLAADTVWARVEATGLHGDRFFGRRRSGRRWAALSDLMWRLAERKRRRWG